MARTKSVEQLENAAETYADDPERVELLERAKRFKTSWVELAEALTEARKRGSWEKWGYPTFEDYARKELHLRGETVEKLTGSFAFLKKAAPQVLHRDGMAAPIPSYESVDFLRRAEEKPDAPRDIVDQVRKRVLEEGAAPKTLTKEFGAAVFPMPAEEKQKRDVAQLKSAAQRLRSLLESTEVVPPDLASSVRADIEHLMAALEGRSRDQAA